MRLLPTQRQIIGLILLIALIALLAILAYFFPWVNGFIAVVIAVALGVVIYDAYRLVQLKRSIVIRANRNMPRYFAVDVATPVELTISNESQHEVALTVFDHVPEYFEFTNEQQMPVSVTLSAHQHADVSYEVLPTKRGPAEFSKTQFRLASPMGLWLSDFFYDNACDVKTYPDFRKIDQKDILSDNENQAGQLTKQRKRGTGTEFSQLREYRLGDSLKQIDYKATARLNKLISKEYEVERDQQVIMLLDCSRRLRAGQKQMTHFDYALNAMVFLARTILKQGDAVGFMSFSGEPRQERFIKPRKGRNSINALLNQVYDLDASRQAPDYLKAAEQLLLRQKRRSLVIVVTSLQDEDVDAVKAMISMLQKRHIVLIANIKEPLLDEPLDIENLDDAVFYASREMYHQQRNTMLTHIKNNRLILLDTDPQYLTAKMINTYLNIKQSGIF